MCCPAGPFADSRMSLDYETRIAAAATTAFTETAAQRIEVST